MRHHLFRLFLPALAAGLVAAVTVAATTRTLSLPRLNDTYRDLSSDIVPVSAGGLTLSIESPRNELRLLTHRVEVTPLADGSLDVAFSADIAGEADLVLSFGDALPPLADVVVLPEQTVALGGRVAVTRVGAGWEVTTRELPQTASLVLESALASKLVTTCELLAVAVPGVQCGGLGRALSVLTLPLPEPGETYVVESSFFSQEEIEKIDRLLGFVP